MCANKYHFLRARTCCATSLYLKDYIFAIALLLQYENVPICMRACIYKNAHALSLA